MANDTVKIVVLSDGTWETVSSAQVWTVTLDGFNKLCDGEETNHLTAADVLDTVEVQ